MVGNEDNPFGDVDLPAGWRSGVDGATRSPYFVENHLSTLRVVAGKVGGNWRYTVYRRVFDATTSASGSWRLIGVHEQARHALNAATVLAASTN